MTQAIEGYHGLVRTDVIERLDGSFGKVLDFGGGMGGTSGFLKKSGRAEHVTVADLVEGERGSEIDAVVVGDLNQLGLIDRIVADHGPFDTVLGLDVFEHLYDPWSVTRRLAEGLRPGGLLVTSIPNVNYVGLVGPLLLKGQWELQDDGLLDRTHIRWFTRETSRRMLEDAGLTVVKLDDTIMPRKYYLLDKLTLGLFRRFFVTQYLLVARRG